MPPLRDNGEWINDSKGKVDLFAKTFQEKSKLPDEYVDCIYVGRPDFELGDFTPLRARYTKKLLKNLDQNYSRSLVCPVGCPHVSYLCCLEKIRFFFASGIVIILFRRPWTLSSLFLVLCELLVYLNIFYQSSSNLLYVFALYRQGF